MERKSIDSIGIFFIFIFVFYVCCYGFPKPGGAIQRERPLGTGQNIRVFTLDWLYFDRLKIQILWREGVADVENDLN